MKRAASESIERKKQRVVPTIAEWEEKVASSSDIHAVFEEMNTAFGEDTETWALVAASPVLVDRAFAGIHRLSCHNANFLKSLLCRPVVDESCRTGPAVFAAILTRYPDLLEHLVTFANSDVPLDASVSVCKFLLLLQHRPNTPDANQCLTAMYASLFDRCAEKVVYLAQLLTVNLSRYAFHFLKYLYEQRPPSLVKRLLVPVVFTAYRNALDSNNAMFTTQYANLMSAMLTGADAAFKTALLDANPTLLQNLCLCVLKSDTACDAVWRLCVRFKRACLDVDKHNLIVYLLEHLQPVHIHLLAAIVVFSRESVSRHLDEAIVRRLIRTARESLQRNDIVTGHRVMIILDVCVGRVDLVKATTDPFVFLMLDVMNLRGTSSFVISCKLSACALLSVLVNNSSDALQQLSVVIPQLVDMLKHPYLLEKDMFLLFVFKALLDLMYERMEGNEPIPLQLNISSAFACGIARVCRHMTKKVHRHTRFLYPMFSMMVLMVRQRPPETLVERDEEFVNAVAAHAVLASEQSTRTWATELLRHLISPERFALRQTDVIAALLKRPVPMTTFPTEDGCSICRLDTCEAEDHVMYTPCFHAYHKSCLEGWLKIRDICPMCNKSVLTQLQKSG